MASSVINAVNPQQGGKKGKGKANKDMMGLMEERLDEVNSSMSSLTGRIEDMEKRIEELEFKVDMDFINKAKAVIVPHASTLFIMDNGQAHVISMRLEVEKERVLPVL